MAVRHDVDDVPETFRAAVESLRAAPRRPEVVLVEAPPPQRLAPWALALTADVVVAGEELATGRLVLLHDPAGHEAWGGSFRLVTFVRVELEAEMAADPLLPGVGWTWLVEALDAAGVGWTAASGTVTRVASESFGAMSDRPPTAEMELRASWTPVASRAATAAAAAAVPDLGPHLTAWCGLLCTAAGLPPVPPGVVPIPARRSPRR